MLLVWPWPCDKQQLGAKAPSPPRALQVGENQKKTDKTKNILLCIAILLFIAILLCNAILLFIAILLCIAVVYWFFLCIAVVYWILLCIKIWVVYWVFVVYCCCVSLLCIVVVYLSILRLPRAPRREPRNCGPNCDRLACCEVPNSGV